MIHIDDSKVKGRRAERKRQMNTEEKTDQEVTREGRYGKNNTAKRLVQNFIL